MVINKENVSEVVEHVKNMASKYDFHPDADCVRGTVEESANLLCIDLDEAEIVDACAQLGEVYGF